MVAHSKYAFAHYFEDVYLQQAGRTTGETVRRQRCHLERFLKFAGETIRCRDVDRPLLQGLAIWMAQRGFGVLTIEKNCTFIRAVVCHFDQNQLDDSSNEVESVVSVARIPRQVRHTRRNLDRGNGAEYLLANVYLDRYEPTLVRSHGSRARRRCQVTLYYFDKFLERSATLDDLSEEIVSAFAAWRLAKGAAPRSIDKDLSNLHTFWRWCQRKGLTESGPSRAIQLT